MELLHIKAFVLAAKHMNFTMVADLMFISQPSISKYISALEAELGMPLFYRASHNIKLTEFGKAFLSFAQGILEKEQEALDFLQMYKSSDSRSLIIGINSSVLDGSNVCLFSALISSVGELKRNHPDVFVKVHFCPNDEMNILIDSGKIDFGILPMDKLTKRRMGHISEYEQLQNFEHYLALPPYLSAEGGFEDISRRLDTLFFMSGPISKGIIDTFMNLYRITPRLRPMEMPSELMLKIISDEGPGIIGGNMLPYMRLLNITTIPLKDMGIESGLYAFWFDPVKTRTPLNPYVKPFVIYMKDWLKVEKARADRLAKEASELGSGPA